ncbi:hypothetical protein FOA43_000971 [Brettanomyces nanus]|uniref:Uncharacterized protein n=1 Tax=Eeniella nana TaxID=13502 RepID=A0A875RY90_EENNA|nr:uncharacterized protein FOA43_000971 [Brettanomyces nanus]QPG73658.1 hypothetical protein FOA43_000971 [Brettanomyces nanus]
MYKPKIFKELGVKRGHTLTRFLSHDHDNSDQDKAFDDDTDQSKRFLRKIKTYSSGLHESPNPPKSPIRTSGRTQKQMGEMKDIAFELKMPSKQNIHPLDQPLILKGGKKLSPLPVSQMGNIGRGSVGSATEGGVVMSMTDISRFSEIVWNTIYKLAMTIWNLDLFINIQRTDNSTIRLHVPSIILALFGIHFLRSMLFRSANSLDSIPYYSTKPVLKTSSTLTNLMNFMAVLGVCGYLFLKMTQSMDGDASQARSQTSQSLKDERRAHSADSNDATTISYSDDSGSSTTYHSLDNDSEKSYAARKRASREGSPLKVPLTLHTQRHKHQVQKLTINRAISDNGTNYGRALAHSQTNDYDSYFGTSTDMEKMKQAGRRELLRAFNISDA